MFEKKLLAIFAALMLSSCATTTTTTTTNTTSTTATQTQTTLSEQDQPDASVDATADTSAIAAPPGTVGSPKVPLLAIEVEVTRDNVRPVGVKLLQSLPIANSAQGDLRVKIEAAREFEYTIADPLVATVHDENGTREITLESAHTFVYAPLLPAIKSIVIEPVIATDAPTRGGVIDVPALAQEACRQTQLQLPICREILAR